MNRNEIHARHAEANGDYLLAEQYRVAGLYTPPQPVGKVEAMIVKVITAPLWVPFVVVGGLALWLFWKAKGAFH